VPKKYQAYLLDLDGTVYRGNEVIEEARDFVTWLQQTGTPYLFLTNNSSMTPEKVAEKLTEMGVETTAQQVYTTALGAAQFIAEEKQGERILAIGEEGLLTALRNQGFLLTEDNPDYVVVGLDRQFTYEKMAKASLAIQQGARFLSTNSDQALPTERGRMPGNGSITAAICTASGVAPTFIGKPEALFVTLALERLGFPATDVLLIGDNLSTDIAAGANAGVDTLLVFTGITQPQELGHPLSLQPTYMASNLSEWMKRS
jgi:4-nitrophenyl phosphatase